MTTKRPRAAKCDAKKFCPVMERSLASEGQKGLTAMDLFNMRTMKRTATLVVYKRTPGDKGVCLNLCPWCGESLRPDWVKAKKATP